MSWDADGRSSSLAPKLQDRPFPLSWREQESACGSPTPGAQRETLTASSAHRPCPGEWGWECGGGDGREKPQKYVTKLFCLREKTKMILTHKVIFLKSQIRQLQQDLLIPFNALSVSHFTGAEPWLTAGLYLWSKVIVSRGFLLFS